MMEKIFRSNLSTFKNEEVRVQAVETKPEKTMSLGFQVAGVKEPLISVKGIVEKCKFVSFGQEKEDNYILNKGPGDKMMLKPNGKGSYLMHVCFVGGERIE